MRVASVLSVSFPSLDILLLTRRSGHRAQQVASIRLIAWLACPLAAEGDNRRGSRLLGRWRWRVVSDGNRRMVQCALLLSASLSGCQSQSVPAERMSEEELAQAVEQAAGVKEKEAVERQAQLLPLQKGDADSPFKASAVCSFSNAAGVLILATPQQALVRLESGALVLPAAGPVIPDGAFFRADAVSLSVGLGATTSELPRIAAGGAEARITARDQRDASVRGSWNCRLARP
jgi:hypothetical protein